MVQQVASKLDPEIEEAMAEVVIGMGLGQLPRLPAGHTLQMMAKAAVTVYEAVVDDHRPRE